MVRAFVLEAPTRGKCMDFAYPSQGVVVQILRAGVCGTDKHIFRGRLPVPFPIIPGHENVGCLEQLPEKQRLDARGQILTEGDRVVWPAGIPCGRCWYCRMSPNLRQLCLQGKAFGLSLSCEQPPHLLGGWAEVVSIPDGIWLFKVPDAISDDVAALLDTLASTYAIDRAFRQSVSPHIRYVVVIGSGPVGLMAAARAQLRGAISVILIGSDARKTTAHEFADVIVPRKLSLAEKKEEVQSMFPRGPDLVIEAAGSTSAFLDSLELVRPGGTVLEIGCFADVGTCELSPHHLLRRNLTLITQFAYPAQEYGTSLSLLQRLQDEFPLEGLVTHRLSLDEIAQTLTSPPAGHIKMIVKPNRSEGM